MQTQTYKSLQLSVPLSVPSTVEEFNQNATRNGVRKGNPCLEDAIDTNVYRGSLAEFRDVFLHGKWDGEKLVSDGVEQITKIKRKTKVAKKNADGTEVLAYAETESDYFDRVLEETKRSRESFQDLATKVAAAIVFDASTSEKKPRVPAKLAEKYKVAAAALIKGKNLQRFIADVAKNTGYVATLTNDAEKDLEIVGRAVKAHSEWKQKMEDEKLVKQYA